MVNRIAEFRGIRGLSVQQLADAVNTSRSQIYKLEKDERSLTIDWIERIASALELSTCDLITDGACSVPVLYNIAAADHGANTFDQPRPFTRIWTPAALHRPIECHAANVLDDSAAYLYPRGSVVYNRPLDCCRAPLAIGHRVVVREYATTRAGATTRQILAGILDRTAAGDLVLTTRSSDRAVPASIVIQPARDFSPRGGNVIPLPAAISYTPREDDPAAIIGRVDMAIIPENNLPQSAVGGR